MTARPTSFVQVVLATPSADMIGQFHIALGDTQHRRALCGLVHGLGRRHTTPCLPLVHFASGHDLIPTHPTRPLCSSNASKTIGFLELSGTLLGKGPIICWNVPSRPLARSAAARGGGQGFTIRPPGGEGPFPSYPG
jgi:hypothetical protein